MDITLTPEQINAFLSQTILESSIGVTLHKIVEEQARKLTSAYDNPLAHVVEQEMLRLLHEMIREEYMESFRAKLRAVLTEECLETIAGAAVTALISNLERERRR